MERRAQVVYLSLLSCGILFGMLATALGLKMEMSILAWIGMLVLAIVSPLSWCT